jgi:hypothetical protein
MGAMMAFRLERGRLLALACTLATVLVASAVGARAAPRATELGPEVALAEPAGGGDIEIVMQATGAPGWHFIDLYPAIYKGSERRPNNYRLPQLTYADDHPGEDLPRFRFAFEVTSGR